MAKSNFNYVAGKSGKVVYAGLAPGTDLVNDLKEICEDSGIRYGVVLSVIGSLHTTTIAQVASDAQKAKFGRTYMEHRTLSGPMEILAIQGWIYENEKGELTLHLHGLINDVNGQVHGGHFLPDSSPIRTRTVAVIAETTGVKLIERFDEKTGTYLFEPVQL